MAERIVTPGVYTRENDQSFLPAAIRSIGAAIIGPTAKGPALIPTIVENYEDFTEKFGTFTSDSYVPNTVKRYLDNSDNITVTRLLYENGYDLDNGVVAIIATSGSGASEVTFVSHVLHPTQPVEEAANLFDATTLSYDESGSFAIEISGSYTASANLNSNVPGFTGNFNEYPVTGTPLSASILQSDNNYLSKVFGNTPKSNEYPLYVQYENTNVNGLFNNIGEVTVSTEVLSGYDFSTDYKPAYTPWITSQKIGSTTRDLFRFHTLSDGTLTNYELKVSIQNIQTANEAGSTNGGYGSFDVIVRRVNIDYVPPLYKSVFENNFTEIDRDQDTDSEPVVLEIWQNVNLNPSSPRYIARIIGDQYYEFNTAQNNITVSGNYANSSKYIRVELKDRVTNENIDKQEIPFGFRAPFSPIPDTSAGYNLSAVTYKTTQGTGTSYNANNQHGFDFTSQPNYSYLAPIPASGSSTGSNTDFYLGDASQVADANYPSFSNQYTGTLQAALTAGTFESNISPNTRKFIVPMQGGFDGARPNLPKFSGVNIKSNNTFGFDCSGANTTGTTAYKKALTILNNTDYYDMNMILTPGIIHNIHGDVSNSTLQMARDRQDTFYVMDLVELNDTISTVTNLAKTLDSSYAATYYPWVKILDPRNNTPFFVPPSVVIPGVIAFNDRTQAPWYAPAGFNRGSINALDTRYALSPTQKGTLYESKVNPIAKFPNSEIVVWGQKTLQAKPSALDRINVRRLLITVKKYIASATQFLVFEQNTSSTRKRFEGIVNPYLDAVKKEQGLYAFKVIMDSTNNTPDLIDQNILYGQIFLQPTRTAEFIILDFNIQPTGASFPE